MKAELRDNHGQVEAAEVSDPPPSRIVRGERVGGELNNRAETFPKNYPIEFVYSLYRVSGGTAIYHFYAARKKD